MSASGRDPFPRERARSGDRFRAAGGPSRPPTVSPLHLLARPLDPPAAVQANVTVARDTGLAVDASSGRRSGASPSAGGEARPGAGQDRRIASLRLVAASALASDRQGWAFLAESVAKTARLGGGTLALLTDRACGGQHWPRCGWRAGQWWKLTCAAATRSGSTASTWPRPCTFRYPLTRPAFSALAGTLGSGLRQLDQRLASYTAEPERRPA